MLTNPPVTYDLWIGLPIFERLESGSFAHLYDVLRLLTAILLHGPGRLISKVKDSWAEDSIFIVKEVAVLNIRE